MAAVIAGGIGLAVALTGVVAELLPRHFTAAQQRQIMAWEVGRRWRTLPAGDIFPATVRYQLPAAALQDLTGVNLEAVRVGIAPQAACGAAAGPAAAQVLGRHGCQAVLRATYIDRSASYVMTVGVAVLPSAAQASAARAELARAGRDSDPGPGVRAVAFGGTPASLFGDGQRQLSQSLAAGPYVIMDTVGYTDGRPRVAIADDSYARAELTSAGQGVTRAVARVLDAPPPAPHCPGTPGC